MPAAADIYTNRMGNVLVVAPTRTGQLRHLADERNVALSRGGEIVKALTRWIFADIPRDTLKDDWGNPFDHQVHTLLAGTVADGETLIRSLEEEGFTVSEEADLFVPFQTLDPRDRQSSDELRTRHARAFALARRERPTMRQLVTSIRDSMLTGA